MVSIVIKLTFGGRIGWILCGFVFGRSPSFACLRPHLHVLTSISVTLVSAAILHNLARLLVCAEGKMKEQLFSVSQKASFGEDCGKYFLES